MRDDEWWLALPWDVADAHDTDLVEWDEATHSGQVACSCGAVWDFTISEKRDFGLEWGRAERAHVAEMAVKATLRQVAAELAGLGGPR
ncbi:MAG: hypothetical protein LBK54_01670 [Propionibacteriaceae bacterium]|nr:hypothetical protein [Propionibacteriaceae bacterium]